MIAREISEQTFDVGTRPLRILAPANPRDALLAGNPARPPFWVRVWPSAVELARMLSAMDLSGTRMIELGAGLGVSGLAAARGGAKVLLTDGEREPLELARRSAALNDLVVETALLDWSDVASVGTFDLAIATEVLNEPAAAGPLARTFGNVISAHGRGIVVDPWFPSHDLFVAALGRYDLRAATTERNFEWHGVERVTRVFEIARSGDSAESREAV